MDATVSGVEVELIKYSQESGTVRTQFDQVKTPVSMAVIPTLAGVKDTDPVALNPLYSTVDTEALDALSRVRNETDGDTHTTFTHEGHEISVHSDGVITITLPEDEPLAEKHERERDDDF